MMKGETAMAEILHCLKITEEEKVEGEHIPILHPEMLG